MREVEEGYFAEVMYQIGVYALVLSLGSQGALRCRGRNFAFVEDQTPRWPHRQGSICVLGRGIP